MKYIENFNSIQSFRSTLFAMEEQFQRLSAESLRQKIRSGTVVNTQSSAFKKLFRVDNVILLKGDTLAYFRYGTPSKFHFLGQFEFDIDFDDITASTWRFNANPITRSNVRQEGFLLRVSGSMSVSDPNLLLQGIFA